MLKPIDKRPRKNSKDKSKSRSRSKDKHQRAVSAASSDGNPLFNRKGGVRQRKPLLDVLEQTANLVIGRGRTLHAAV